ncbi:MAG: tRNA lysidine(34) synthetase TilS [Planctomycetes bacterium]|nr:tRNA lysidine(34) synthetase TilS [Planctomycetota bacterium]
MTPDPKARFTDFVRATIARYDLLPRATDPRQPRETVVVGTSGGPDSVALLRVLDELARTEFAVTLVVAHLNHGLRGAAADEDQAFVEGLARQMGLPCEAARVDVRAEARALGIGIEEAGRLVRRRFLAETARKHGARKVALAHHADDRAETVLFNILRGTGIEGLAAMKPRAPLSNGASAPDDPSRRVGAMHPPSDTQAAAPTGGCKAPTLHVEIIRPMIETPRDLVLGYLAALSQDYRQDETNLADDYTRNRVRNMLLPLLAKEFNPKVEEALVRLSEQASAAGDVLADALDAVWRQIVREMPSADVARLACPAVEDSAPAEPRLGKPAVPHRGEQGGPPLQTLIIDADDFIGLRPWMQGAILRRAVERLGGGLKHMSAERTREVVSALLAKTIVGPIDLPGGLAAERNRRAIRIGRG